ncbi:MAG: NAD-binding protein [Candidatus Accumulibacter phosphatis]|uniref:NAD-binding protein n=2 Tax=Candidatus Accumulibacter TaxID=327159 RepID=A0A7D5S8T6_9PROT|nr:NAD-binding protein [Accumulibacter sp.]MCQ1547295.1 NAD-binding protein [Candidatus Accumulibacter phosphatis]QLH49100.1 MAG: NAD-binding protein [Candidatus Accumulibacter cognatus]HMW57762.1 NAD-binding protein [Accumulibacter sp.]
MKKAYRGLHRSTWRLLGLLVSMPTAVVVFGTIFMFASDYLEGKPLSFWASLEWASETLTTTGYGAYAPWSHPLMIVFVILTQFVGMFFLVLVFPFYVMPYIEERFELRLPHALPEMNGRVLFYRYGPAIESLLDEFDRTRTPFVVVEEDIELARNLRNRGYAVVFGRLDEEQDLLSGVAAARAVVANADDHANAVCIMIAREQGFSGPIYALADDPMYRPPMIQVGASEVFTPAHVLAAALAARASTRISPPAEGMHMLGGLVGLAEFRVRAGSALAGMRLGDLQLRARYGVTVIGQWTCGNFSVASGPATRIEAGAILVVGGAHNNLAKVESLALPIRRRGPIVLAGYGVVGQKVAEMLADADETTIVIDQQGLPGVDICGNVLDRLTMERAGLREASAMVLTLSNDSEGVFATAVIRDHAPEIPLIVRANRAQNIPRLYQAGADFALSVGQVAGQILAYHLCGEQAAAVQQRLKFIRVAPGALVGGHPWRETVRERTGAAIVAVERDESVIVEFGSDFVVRPEDVLFVCGTFESLEAYLREFHTAVVTV